MSVLWLLSLWGCHKGAETEHLPDPDPAAQGDAPPQATAADDAPTPNPADASDLDAIIRALSMRDAPPSCDAIDAMTPEPVDTLLTVVRTVQMPPTVPMRAAGCLLDRHAAEIETEILAWMSDAQTAGLALLVVDAIDTLPPDLAKRAAQEGLAGPHSDKLRPRLAESSSPEIKALLTP